MYASYIYTPITYISSSIINLKPKPYLTLLMLDYTVYRIHQFIHINTARKGYRYDTHSHTPIE